MPLIDMISNIDGFGFPARTCFFLSILLLGQKNLDDVVFKIICSWIQAQVIWWSDQLDGFPNFMILPILSFLIVQQTSHPNFENKVAVSIKRFTIFSVECSSIYNCQHSIVNQSSKFAKSWIVIHSIIALYTKPMQSNCMQTAFSKHFYSKLIAFLMYM